MPRARILAAAMLACLLASPVQAQWDKMTPTERQALASHRLTMDNVTRTVAAGAKLEALSKDPQIKALMDQNEATSLSDAIAKMDAVPQIHSTLEENGLTSTQFMYTVIELASTRAAIKLQAMGGSAAKAAAQLPTSPQNLEFYAAHSAELEPLAAKMMASEKDSSD